MSSSLEEIEKPDYNNNKIFWAANSGWFTWSKDLGYPRPQNITMYQTLTAEKQASLNRAYLSVHGNSVDNVGKEWLAYS